MKHLKPTAALAIILTLLVSLSLAQSGRKLPSDGPRPEKDDIVRLRADEVLLNVTVLDPYGRQATDLSRSDFIVAEDGKRQDIASFLISSVPVNVVLLLDASGSVVSEIDSLRQAAMQFVNALGPEDRISVIEFHTKLELIQDWTARAEDVRHALSWRFKPGMVMNDKGRYEYGQTALYDAVYSSADEQLAKVDGRKAIIILTDGDDSSSKVTYEQALGAVIKTGAVVYVVSKARAMLAQLAPYLGKTAKVFGGGSAQQASMYASRLERAEQIMTDLSRRTGGQIYSPMQDKEMGAVYAQVAREIKNQYIITYVSKNETRDGRLRRINVFLTRPGYTSRTRDSYYAPREGGQ
jgi:Ca-activated chloride channel family protein